MPADKFLDRPQDTLINVHLCFTAGLQVALRDEQRVITAFHYVQLIRRPHLATHSREHIQGTERIARALHEQNRGGQLAQNLVAQLAAITAAAERIAEANHRRHGFLQRQVTSYTSAHALPDQHDRSGVRLPRLFERGAMRLDKLRQRVRAPATFRQIRVVEGDDVPDRRQQFRPAQHPRMRRRSACAVGKEKQRFVSQSHPSHTLTRPQADGNAVVLADTA
jgi:hypothetical protein